MDALLHLENLLESDFEQHADREHSAELRKELETMLDSYKDQINTLAELISDYHELYHKARMQFLSPKLKALRKQAGQDSAILPLLAQNIRLVYST